MSDKSLLDLIAKTICGRYPGEKVMVWVAIPAGIIYGCIPSPADFRHHFAHEAGESEGDFVTAFDYQPPSPDELRPYSDPFFSLIDVTFLQGAASYMIPHVRVKLASVSAWGLDLPSPIPPEVFGEIE